FQQRNWPEVRAALLNDDPIILPLEEDLLTIGFEKAIALPASQRIAAVQKVQERSGAGAKPRDLARAVLTGTQLTSVETRQKLIDASPAAFAASTDPAIVFARDFLAAQNDQRQRQRILNEKL